MALEFVGTSLALSKQGFAAAADGCGVKAAEVWSVLAVETLGCGFESDRRPNMLFERHTFHRLTGGRFDDGDISDPKQGGYGAGGAHQYDRLSKAITKDRIAALKSASWGLGQILGENFASAGFADVESMVKTMCDSEDAQLAAMSAFLKASGAGSALAIHDWATFARIYNGPSYAKNKYDSRLRAEYAKYSTGVTPDLDVRAAQVYLGFCGFDVRIIDGILGPMTRSAILEFQSKHGFQQTGKVDDGLLAQLVQTALS